jgi:nucleoside-diphosphate-sugar epimerase
MVKGRNEVVVFDNFSTGRKENLQDCLDKITLIEADIRNFEGLKEASREVTQIYHLAAISSVPLSVDDPRTTADVNVNGTWNVLEACRINRVKRLVFVSSASVYGETTKVPFKESMSLRASSPYAASKLIGEQLCDLYWRLYGLETIALRLFSVYGPSQSPHSQYANVIPAFATRLLNGDTPTVYGDGKQTRDFIFVEDVVKAFQAAGKSKKVIGEVINFGSGRQISIVQLLKMIQLGLKTNIIPKFSPKKAGDDPRTCADTTNAKRLLGINRVTPFQEGLKKTLKWFKENRA